jgi:hypothetical protein
MPRNARYNYSVKSEDNLIIEKYNGDIFRNQQGWGFATTIKGPTAFPTKG